MAAIGAGIAILAVLGAGLGMGIATGKACESAAKINTLLLLGCALAESTAIYAFVVALILAVK